MFVIPLLWCVLAGSSALLLGVPPDWMLLLCAVAIAFRTAMPDRIPASTALAGAADRP
jgi:hypothetical protein